MALRRRLCLVAGALSLCESRCRRYTGWSQHGEDYIEPHVVGEDGYGYLRLYEMSGQQRYLQAAIHCADALVKNYKPGDAERSPWPYRAYARDGHAGEGDMGIYSANVVEPIMLLDELCASAREMLIAISWSAKRPGNGC